MIPIPGFEHFVRIMQSATVAVTVRVIFPTLELFTWRATGSFDMFLGTNYTVAMAEIFHEVPIKASPTLIYRMITEAELLSQWWLAGAKIEPQKGAIGRFPLSDGENYISIRVSELVSNKKIVWQCLGHKFTEWTGTQISFEISPDSLLFRHTGWKDNSGVFGKTSFYWASLYLQNLKRIAESQ